MESIVSGNAKSEGNMQDQLEHGLAYETVVNRKESARLARHPDIRAKAQQCYINALRVVWYVPGYERADYVEGLAVLGCMIVEHGWVEHAGQILDPTLYHREQVRYFPGLRWSGKSGVAQGMALPKPEYTEDLPLFYRFGWGGGDNPEFCRARAAATAEVCRISGVPLTREELA